MSLDVFKVYIEGYSDHILDLEILSIQQGYWAGYYTNSKKPKSVKYNIEKMLQARKKNSLQKSNKNKDVDVETFKRLEAKFKSYFEDK